MQFREKRLQNWVLPSAILSFAEIPGQPRIFECLMPRAGLGRLLAAIITQSAK